MFAIGLTLSLFVFAAPAVMANGELAGVWLELYAESTCLELLEAVADCSLCHTISFGLNPYGEDMQNNNNDPAVIGGSDSDGDGRTNDEEILEDCTLPGDATSAAQPMTWSLIKTLYSH
jgi:hypothetical protein